MTLGSVCTSRCCKPFQNLFTWGTYIANNNTPIRNMVWPCDTKHVPCKKSCVIWYFTEHDGYVTCQVTDLQNMVKFLKYLVYVWPNLSKAGFYRCMHSTARHTFTIKRWLYKLMNYSSRYWCWKFPSWVSMSAWMFFKWLYPPWQADSWLWFTTQLADEFGNGFSYFVLHVEVKMAPVDAFWLFTV